MSQWREWTALHICFFVTFIISGLAINLVQALLYLLVGWWHHTLFRRLNYYLVWMIYAQLLFVADWWSSSELRLYADPQVLKELSKESGIVIMNHHFELDWLFGWMAADRNGVLGNARVFVKQILKYVPIVGWAWNFSDVAYLARNWEKDQAAMTESVNRLADYPHPVWLLLFAEGTRISPEKLEASREFARKRGLPLLRHCLTPRSKGFVHVMQHLNKDKVKYVYDVTLAVHPRDGAPATMSNILLGRTTVGEVYIRRFSVDDVPKDSEGATKFLMKLYEDKDALIDSYARTGSFTKDTNFQTYPMTTIPRRVYSLLNTVALNLLIMPTVLAQIGSFAFSGSLWQFALAVLLVAGTYFALKKFIGLTKFSKASSYGKKKE